MKPTRRTVIAAVVSAPLLAALAFVLWPLPEELLAERPIASVRITDRRGGLLRELRSQTGDRCVPLSASEIPPHVAAAFLAAEDAGFRSHLGVSPTAILRAAWQNVRARRVVAGGSTLTQQLARLLVPRERTLRGKLGEALWAVRLELHLSKDALLTAVPEPRSARERRDRDRGRVRALLRPPRLAALDRAGRGARVDPAWADRLRPVPQDRRGCSGGSSGCSGGWGSLAEALADARKESIELGAFAQAFRAPHFVEFVRRASRAPELSDATVIETTIDPELQRDLETAVHDEVARLAERRVGSAAAIVIDNRTDEVLAYVGSADFFDAEISGQNDGVQMKRQPGSALKPFVYAEAFSHGFTPASVVPDLETSFPGQRGAYLPHNYDRTLHGPVRLREALGSSFNVPAVRIADALGPERVLESLHRAGFDSLNQEASHYGLGMVLGNGEVSLYEAARAYAGFARGGEWRPLRFLRRATRADGSELALPGLPPPHRMAEPSSVALISDVLSDNSARAAAFGVQNALRLPFPVAAKTGTSKGYSDNWTVGYTRERTVAVWAGNFDGTPMVQVSGITGAGPIFRRAMLRAMDGVAPAPLVDRELLEEVDICPLSGERATASCPATMHERFARGTAPKHECAMHRPLAKNLPADLRARCRALAAGSDAITDLGPEYYEWAKSEGRQQDSWLAPACAEAAATEDGALRGAHPAHRRRVPPLRNLPLEDQTIPLRIRARPQDRRLEVRLDGKKVAELSPPFTSRLAAEPGDHALSVLEPGKSEPLATVRFKVR